MTSHFDYHDRTLCADHTPLTAIAEQFGTPCFVYSADALSESFASYANAFAGQEPGSADEIQSFCTTNFSVQFPMFEKTNINSNTYTFR